MGIRGAWSLLSNDPRRFGSPWLLSDEEQSSGESLCVFVDGPSLLYHLAVSDVYDPPVTEAQFKWSSSIQQASPATIHARVTSFMEALLQVCHGGVHVVLDGLVPAAKILTQVDRLRSMARLGEQHATKPNTPCKLLHLLAERTMIEALEDLMEEQSRLFFHQPPRGEAETYIDCWVRNHALLSEHVFIFSDDTDFLVYSSCPGLIPLKTLEFHVLEGRLSLTGFHYQRTKFAQAFFSGACTDPQAMTVVAALAGCDYGMTECMIRARTVMIKSDIGGLRPRLRNDPTSAAALTAILRYVAHWTKRHETSWLQAMAEAVCTNLEERKLLIASLEEIHGIYFPNEHDSEAVGTAMSVECRRLLECGILYCKPLVETWHSSSEVRQTHASRKRARKSRKGRRKKRPLIKQDAGEMDYVHNPPRDAAVPFPPTQSFVDQCLATGSAWSLFEQVRRHLYSLVCHYVQVRHQDHRIQVHPTWSSSNPIVTEYVRLGTGGRVDFISMPVALTKLDVAPTGSFLDALLRCILDEDQTNLMKQNLEQDWQVMAASLMLPARTALLLLLLYTTPLRSSEAFSCSTQEELSSSLKQSLVLISVALFHANLLDNVLYVCEGRGESKTLLRERIPLSHIFRYDVAAWIWTQMIQENNSDDVDEVVAFSPMLDSFFDQLNVSRAGVLVLNALELQEWHEETKELWRRWCMVSIRANHDE